MADSRIDRREFLSLCASAGLLALGGCRSAGQATTFNTADEGPIDWTPLSDLSGFGGDSHELSHRILRDGGVQLSSLGISAGEQRPLVIVGGGISGLMSAYLLREFRPMILESAPRFGGNSRGEAIGDAIAPMGAAYCLRPDTGTVLDDVFRELALYDQLEIKAGAEPFVVDGRWVSSFWTGESDPKRKAAFASFYDFLKATYEENDGRRYPEIPSRDGRMRSYLGELDQFSLKAYLERYGILPLHPQIEAYVESFCWSAFGGGSEEVSAAAGLSFLADEVGPLCIGHGGNAAIAEALYRKLADVLPERSLRANASVVQVRQNSDGCEVVYADPSGTLHRVRSRAVVMACPKFVARRILELSEERSEAFRKIEYRPYLLAHAELDRKVEHSGHDVYVLRGHQPKPPKNFDEVRAGGVVIGRALARSSGAKVLTLYCPLPGGFRSALMGSEAESRLRKALGQQLKTEILPGFGVPKASVEGLRLVRWGHPLPLSRQGMYQGNTIEALSDPWGENVFFVSQDNWALPAFETGAMEAIHWAPKVRAALEG